jgi:hypothetical protein
VASAVAAQAAIAADPSLPVTGWDGRGFASWLTLNVPAAGYASRPAPGYVWDAARFSAADLPSGNEWAGATPLQRQVGAATGVPRVSGEQYAAVLTALAEDVNARRFDRAETARRVRDDCARAGHPVGRALVTYVVNGLLHAGFPMRAPTSAAQLAGAWVDTVEAQYLGAGMALDDASRRELRDWLGGGLAPLL